MKKKRPELKDVLVKLFIVVAVIWFLLMGFYMTPLAYVIPSELEPSLEVTVTVLFMAMLCLITLVMFLSWRSQKINRDDAGDDQTRGKSG